jgi:hypothetical protein
MGSTLDMNIWRVMLTPGTTPVRTCARGGRVSAARGGT